MNVIFTDIMNYLENFKYWLINRPIFEMAYYRKYAIDSIRSLSGTILMTHILCYKLFLINLNMENYIKITMVFYKITYNVFGLCLVY